MLACLVCLSASAASLVLTTNAPTPGTNDVYNFIGGANDDANVASGNDQFTYVAADRPTQGQTFTTPTNSGGGYLLRDIWIRHCGYQTAASSGNGTWWNLAAGAVYTIRVTDPSKTNQAAFVISSETYTATGTEAGGSQWIGGSQSNPQLGDDYWLHFTLATPVQLAAGTRYGFDLTATSAAGGNFFEWLGNRTNVYASGQPYTGTTAGTVGTTENFDTGARVFLVALSPQSAPLPQVAPNLSSPLRFQPVGQSVQVIATIPAIVNAQQSATLVLTNNNPGLISLPGGAGTLTLNFAAGATNAQSFNVQVLAQGQGSLSVVTNASFADASITIGTPLAAQEEFVYDSGTQPYLDQANGGSGFAGPWSEPSAADYIYSGLTYGTSPSLVTSGNSVAVSGASDAFRKLSGTYGGVGGGTVWISFLVQAPNGLVDWAGLSLFTSTNAEKLFMGEVFSQSPNNTWGFSQANTYYMNFANSDTPGAQTDLLVYRVDFPTTNGGPALVSFYDNPTMNGLPPYSPTGSGYVNNFTFDSIRLGDSASDGLFFDEIRIGTDWTNVMQFVGPPQPLVPPVPTLSTPARFAPVGQAVPLTVSIPADAPRPLTMTITNDNPSAFSLSATNAAMVTLTFDTGATNVQTLNVPVLTAGAANLTVVSNATVGGTTLAIASQVLAGDSFDYPAGTDTLAGSLGGSGFDATGWTGGGSVVSPGLTYPGLLTSSNAAYIDATGTGNAQRTFFTSSGSYGGVNGGTVWIGFLVQGAFPSSAQVAGVSLLNNGAQVFFMGLDTTQPNNGKWGYTGTGAGETGFPNSVAPSTNTDLLVYRLDFPTISGGLVNVTFYADPPPGPNPPAAPTGTGGAYSFNFNGIQLGTTFTMTFDEVRVGASWSDVVPVAAAAQLTLQKVSGNQLQLSWPSALANYQLESSASLTGGWAPAGLSIATTNGMNVVTDTVGGSAKFYRLHQP